MEATAAVLGMIVHTAMHVVWKQACDDPLRGPFGPLLRGTGKWPTSTARQLSVALLPDVCQ